VNPIYRSTSSWRAARSLLLAGLVAGTAAACSEPTALNQLPAGTITIVPTANMRAEDLSSDGTTILLTDVSSPTADFYFYDIATGTTTLKGSAGNALFNFATGISNGLRVSAIHGKPENAGLWQQASGWFDLGSIYSVGCEFDDVTHAQDKSGGWDIDSAGHSTVGLIWNGCSAEAFLWSDASGGGAFIALDNLGVPWPGDTNPPHSRATVISDDGSTLGGWAQDTASVGGTTFGIDRRPTIWTSNGAGAKIPSGGVFTDDCPGEVLAIAGNGSLAAGVWCQHAFLWSTATGAIDLTPASGGYGQAVALNGQLVFGTSGGGFDPAVPFVWTQAAGVKSLVDIAEANGITIPANYYWQAVVAASADGTIVVGTMYDDTFTTYTVVLELPVSAYGL
jgi:hypothetical protein